MAPASVFLLLVCAQAQAQAPAPAASAAPAEAIAAWPGDIADGLAALVQAVGADEPEPVVQLAATIAAAAREREPDEQRRARVLHDTGLACARVGALEPALADLQACAGLAGPGQVRASALYAAGTARLERAELLRLAVPEIAQAQGLPAPEATEDQGGPSELDVARQAYLAARAALCERLRVGWRDEDTRANLELITRRLRELEQIEREREQQQQQQDDQQQPDPQSQPPDQPPDQNPSQDSQQQDPSEQSPDPSESEDSQQPQEDPAQDEASQDEQEQPPEEDQQGQPDQPDESQPSESPEEGEPQPAELEERVLSHEEVQRLLDQLAEIEEQAAAVRARLRQRRRKPVEKDW